MPLDLIPLKKGFCLVSPGDRGFLITLHKNRWNEYCPDEAVKFFQNFSQLYYEFKCPDENEEADKSTDEPKADIKEDESEEPVNTESKETKEDKSCIEFVVRRMHNPKNNVGFVATNLADPSGFAHFLLNKLSNRKECKKPRMPFRILPVQRVCEAKASEVEKVLTPLLVEEGVGQDDFAHRFSLIYHGYNGGENLAIHDAKAMVRNCIWALNPNCVQCIKYQDWAVVMDILDPLFMVGIAKDFYRLASYNTWIIRHGPKIVPTVDSEDEISDDPTLSENEEMNRKLRLKRKRKSDRAEWEEELKDGKTLLQQVADENSDGEDEKSGHSD